MLLPGDMYSMYRSYLYIKESRNNVCSQKGKLSYECEVKETHERLGICAKGATHQWGASVFTTYIGVAPLTVWPQTLSNKIELILQTCTVREVCCPKNPLNTHYLTSKHLVTFSLITINSTSTVSFSAIMHDLLCKTPCNQYLVLFKWHLQKRLCEWIMSHFYWRKGSILLSLF